MEWLAYFILLVSNIVGFFAIFLTTFGTFIMVAGAFIFSWMTDFRILTPQILFWIFVLYVIGEILEYLLVVLGTRKFGGSKASVWGAVLGGIAGALLGAPFFGVGAFFGTFAGIFLGACLVEWYLFRDVKKSLMAGAGGVFGRAGSIAAKLVLAFIIYGIEFFRIAGFKPPGA